jgi:hypothetical protein
MESAVDYIIQMIAKVLREDVKSVCMKQSSVDAFLRVFRFMDAAFHL